ncbi:MAG TPA: SpoIID/LytB domain-containing protein [Bacteroidales bacterium]|nr:SpoIID/LytB domain-containing protein [Bacteroidales bacterium]
MTQEPKLTVGIMFEPEINFSLLGKYTYEGQTVLGIQHVAYANGKIAWNGKLYDELLFTPQDEKTDAFELIDVTIGIEFHWERKENQRFTGALKIIVENEKLTAINVISVEDYLTSVISSEMSATASLELLKAHAVISRSWVLSPKIPAPHPPKGGVKSAYPPLYSRLKELALKHRHNPTDAESFLWENLKGKNLDGYKFRRQHIIDDCIVDFVCLSERLIIEVDGKYHDEPDVQEYDKLRTQLLNRNGYKVIRFTNEEVLFEIEKVLNSIKSELHTNTPPSGGGGAGLIWYERDAHTNFDVCADDHCQRYQGITRASTEIVKQAIAETCGQVLTYEGKICDARFSKCCGGVFEEFQNCWNNIYYPYLRKTRDYKSDTSIPDLTIESEAEKWIRTLPEAFCNTKDKQILSQVLNNYDQETTDFYRWKVAYSQKELSELILKRSGVDYGKIIDLLPIERGTSGRLIKLKIIGTKRTRTIGKELEIRRTLSESHLYSSAFVVDKEFSVDKEIPSKFILTGAGWGHGVGLCQIGASVMGEMGYDYKEILEHYYPDSEVSKLY